MLKKILPLLWGIGVLPFANAVTELQLNQAVSTALQRDQGIVQFEQQAQAAQEEAVAASQLPDPSLMLGANNFPTDTFERDQEPMTQLNIGLSQQFPAGDTLALRGEINELSANAMRQRASLRELEVIKATRQQWFEVFYWQQAIAVYRADETLFTQLLTITQSLFSVGRKQQHDVLRAELEISRLKERIITAQKSLAEAQSRLARWVGDSALISHVPGRLSPLKPVGLKKLDPNQLAQALSAHPLLQKVDQEVERSERSVSLAEQSYKPRWGIDFSYGFRDGENVDGLERADFASVRLNVQLPLFTEKRQDRSVASRRALYASEQARYTDTLRDHTMRLMAQHARWKQLQLRRQLFESDILKQSKAQAEATLNAYQSDTTDFAELMRSYLSDQRTQLEYQRLRVNEQQLLSDLHFLAGTPLSESGVN